MLAELALRGLGSFFIGWTLLIALVSACFLAGVLEYRLCLARSGEDYSSSVT